MTANRRIFLNIVATYGRSLYALVIGLFCGRWTLMTLGEVDYGLIGVVGGLIAFVGYFQRLLSGGVGRFYALSIGEEEKNYQEGVEHCRAWFTASLVVNTTVPLLLLSVGYPIGEWAVRSYLTIPPDRVASCLWVWRFSCFSFIIGLMCAPFNAMYGAKQEIAELTIYGFATSTANVFFLYYAINHPGDWLVRFSAWSCFLGISPSLIMAFRSFRKYSECRVRVSYLNCWSRIKQLFWWNGWITFGVTADTLRRQGVSILINKVFGPRTNAAWNVGNSVSGHCTTLSGSLLGAFYPAIYNAWGAGKYDEAKMMGYRVCKLSVLFVLIFAIPLCLEINELLRLWLKNPPAQAAGICVCVIGVSICEKLTDGLRMVINANGNIAQYQIWVGGTGLGSVLLLSLVFVWMGCSVYYIALAVVLSWAAQSLTRVVLAKKLLQLSPWRWVKKVVLPILIAGSGAVMIGLLSRMFMEPSFVRIMVTTILTVVPLVGFSWLFVVDNEERAFVVQHLGQIMKRLKKR